MPGSDRNYPVDAICAWHHSYMHKRIDDACSDPMLAGDGSPALERCREEKAKIAKLQREQMELDLLPRDDLLSAFLAGAAVLRAAGERLQRECGEDASRILSEAIDDAERISLERVGGQV